MSDYYSQKSTVDEIRTRFDNDVERFSNLETGQSATIDAPLAMDLITRAAVAATPKIQRVLDIGCGAGNNTLKLRQLYHHDFDCDLLDLSEPMLQRAEQRLQEINRGKVRTHQVDIREAKLYDNTFDVILAAAVLHHLRDKADWKRVFQKLYDITAPGGSIWITDLVIHEIPGVQAMMWERYGDYLTQLNGADYREKVFAYIEKEDTPRPVTYQLELLKEVGFKQVDLLHKNSCFAAFGAIKS